jgi:activator of HSP90 ATPase
VETKTIRQVVIIAASQHEVYEALLDSAKHSRFTGDEADISRRIGGRFTASGGYINGVNLKLVHDRKIVQSWHASDWPDGHYSRGTFSFKPSNNGTRLTFTQSGVPVTHYENISQGWRDYYWEPLKGMLEK